MSKQLITLNESGMVTPLTDSIRKQMEGVSRISTTPLVPPPSAGSSAVLGVGGIEPLDPKIASMLPSTFAQSMLVGGEGARQAMFPDEFAKTDEEKVGILERGWRDIEQGVLSLIPASMSVLGGAMEILPLGQTVDQAGNALAQKGIQFDQWITDNVAVENPTMADHIITGLANTIPFFLTGVGTAALIGRTAMVLKLAPAAAEAFTALTGAASSAFVESSIEQGQRQQELMAQGLTAGEALERSAPVFWENMAVLTVTNKLSYFAKVPDSVKNKMAAYVIKAVRAAFFEGGQERAQGVIQDVAAGRGVWADFFDPSKYVVDTVVGSVVGGALGGFETDHRPARPAAPGQQPPSSPTPPPAASGPSGPSGGAPQSPPPAGGQPAAPAPGPVAPAAVPDGMEPPPAGWETYSDEPAAPLATPPAQQETPPAAATVAPEPIPTPATAANPTPTREIVNHLINEQDGTVSEVIAEPDGTFSVDTTDSESGDRIELRKRFPTQAAADEHARLMTGMQDSKADPRVAKIEAAGGKAFVDNPGGQWLADTQQEAADALARSPIHGRARGKLTAGARHESFPVSELINLPGAADEQNVIDQKNVDELAASMKAKGFKEGFAPLIMVGADGKPYIGEGNHRIRAAAQAGLTTIPADIRYYAGGEDAQGPLSMDKVADIISRPDKQEAVASPAAETPAPAETAAPVVEQPVSPPPEPVTAAEPAGAPVGKAEGEAAPAAAAVELSPAAQATADRYDGDRWTVHQVPISEITERPEDMQNRDAGASQKTIDSIKEDYNEAHMQPILLWLDPVSGELVTVQGHSRTEGFRQSGKTKIPAFIFKNMTFDEALKIAAEGNFTQDQGNDLDRIGALKKKIKNEGITGAGNISDVAHKMFDRNGPTIIALMHLNPSGRVMDALRRFVNSEDEGDSGGNIKKIAKWIGEARRRNPDLTDAHEGEMFDALREKFGKVAWAKTEQDFLRHVRGLAEAEGFDPSTPLNLTLEKRTLAEREYDAELAQAEADLAEAERALKEREDELKGFFPKLNDKGKVVKDRDGNVVKEKVKGKEIAPEIAGPILAKMRDKVQFAKDARDDVIGKRERVMEAEQNQGGLFRITGKKPSYASLNKSAAAAGLTQAERAEARDVVDELAVRVAKMFGFANVEFVTGLRRADGKMAHGYFQPQTNTVFLNVESKEPLLTVLMHEVGHRMKAQHPDLWAELQHVLKTQADDRGKRIYTNDTIADRGYSPGQVENEWVSDGLMEASTSPLFWNEIKVRNPQLAGKLIDMIVDALRAIRTMFARSGASVDVYYKNFGVIQQQVGKIAAEMVAREEANQLRPKVNPAQQSMFLLSRETVDDLGAFRIGPASSPEMQERIDATENALHRAKQARQHSTWSGFWRMVYREMLDKNTFQYSAEKKAQKAKGFKREFTRSPYVALRLLRTWVSNANISVEYGVYSWDGKTLLSQSLRDIIKKHGIAADIDSGEMGTFWKAATLVSRRWAIGDKFFGDDPTSQQYQDAAAEYQKWQDLYDKYSKLHPEWVTNPDGSAGGVVGDLTAWAYARVERAYQSGAISIEDRDNLKGKYGVYAPLMRIEDEGYSIGKGDIVGAGRLAHEMKRFDPTAIYMDPFDAAIKQTYGMEFFSKNNEARRTLADFITDHRDKPRGAVSLEGVGYRVKPKTNPVYLKIADMLKAAGFSDAEIKSIDKWIGGHGPKVVNGVDIRSVESAAKMYVTSTFQEDGVIALMRDGEVEYWKLEPDIYEAWAGTSDKEMKKWMKIFTWQSNMLRAGAILTPDFIVKNPVRDMMSAGILANSMVNNPKDAILLPLRIARGMSSAIKKDARWLEFFSNAGNGNLVSKDQGELPKATKELTSSKFKYVVHGHPLNLLRAISNITEEGTRTAVFAKTKADLMGKKMSEAEATVRAAIEASEASIDFSRSGRYGEVINRIIPFFNANLQDNDKLFRAAFVDDGKSKVWMRGIIMLSLPSIALWLINHDDDWYKDQPIWVKNNFWLFSFDGGKTIHKLVKPFGVGLTFASLPERVLDWQKDQDPKAMKEWAAAEMKNFFVINDKNPIASGAAMLGPMGSTLQEIGSNYDAYKGAPIVKGWLEEVEPREQYTSSTSEFAKWAGGMAPGGGLSPMMIDHFIRGSFGGLGAYGAQILSEAVMLADPDRRKLRPASRTVYDEIPDWIPVIKSTVTTTPMTYTRQMQEFFDIYDESREAVKTLQAHAGSGAGEDKIKALYRRSGAAIVMSKPAMATAEAMGKVSKQIRAAENAPPSLLTRDQKREKIDKLIQMRNTYAEKFMEQYQAVDLVALQKQIDAQFPKAKKGR